MKRPVAENCVICGHADASVTYSGLRYRKKPTQKTYSMLRCGRCRLLYVWPRPGESELGELYTDQDYRAEELAVRLAEDCRLEMDILRRLERYLPDGRVLDVGCGAGHFLNCARERGWETHGIEIASHSAEFARASYGLSVQTKPVEALRFPPGFFDLITLIGVIEHVPSPVEFLQELEPLLRPGGILFLLTDNVRSWMHWVMRDRFPWLIPPEHLQLFSTQSMTVLLRRTGFELCGIQSMETIFDDAAIRGIAALLRRNGRRLSASSALQKCVRPLLWATYPARWLLWQFNLGAQIYVFARKSNPGGDPL